MVHSQSLFRKFRIFEILVFVCLLAASSVAKDGAKAVKTPQYNTLFIFGDSYSDTGARYLDGNGPTAVAYFAENLGIPLTHSKDPAPGNKSLNFAATAATSGEDKGGDWCCQGMMDQVNDFAARVRSGNIVFKPGTTLFFLEGGLNDTDLTTEVTIKNLTSEIQLLQSLGARHFTLSILPTKVPDFSKVAERLNPAYQVLVVDFQKKGVDIRLNHWGLYLDQIMENPSRHGIVNTTSQCAGRELFKEDPTPCAKPDAYFYFHSGHPSAAVNKIIGAMLYQELTGQAAGAKQASAAKQ
jgi:cholinesterase